MAKKINAVLGISIIVIFLVHIIYEIVAYLTFYYNPAVTKIIAYTALGAVALHILMSIYIVAFVHDKGKGMKYPALNARTLIQRITAVLMTVLVIFHMNTFKLLSMNAKTNMPAFVLVLAVQIIFYASVLLHVAVSAGNALITLGLVTSGKTRKKIDIVVWIICAVLFAAASVIIVKTQVAMFLGQGGAS